MKSDYTLVDGEDRTQEPPLFAIPSPETKRLLRVHDRVMLGIYDTRPQRSLTIDPVWLRITGIAGSHFTGVVISYPALEAFHGVGCGSALCFESKHILEVALLEDELTNVAFFSQLEAEVIQALEMVCCSIDAHTRFAVSHGEGCDLVGIYKRFPIRRGLQPEMMEFLAATSSSNNCGLTTWPAGDSSDGDTATFTIAVPKDLSGEQILARVKQALRVVESELHGAENESTGGAAE